MLEHIKKNVDRKTFEKINNMLKTEDGQKLLREIKAMDKEQLLKVLEKKDLSGIDFSALNKSLQNVNMQEVLRKLNGGGK